MIRQVACTHTFKVSHSDKLLEFLLRKMQLSRNSVKGLLSDHKVLVNGKMTSQFDYPLAKDDEVKIARNPVRMQAIEKAVRERKPAANPIRSMIIYEDENYLVINKPNGLLSVESDKERNCAYGYAVDYLKEKDKKARPYILHRIDKETSGVLVFAKDIELHSKLKMHWSEDVQLREYIAIVSGKMEKESGTITSYLKENSSNMVYVSKDKNGKKSITHYEVLEANDDYSLLRVHIDTGRKNQIRVQMASLGHPIIGDDKYGNGIDPLKRLGLHASRLDFIDPSSGRTMSFKARTPKNFQELFN